MGETESEHDGPFRVLYVCTGNICRSPYAELHTRFLLEAWLGRGAGRFAIASAGVGAVVGSEMHPYSREQLATRRDHPAVEAFRARQLPDPEVAAADLVLTMNRRQRSRVLSDVPRALRRTFTLREFARLLDAVDPASLPADPVARARAAVPAALAARGAAGPVPAEDDAVGDPIGGEPDAHVEATRAIDAAVRRILGVVVPPPPPQQHRQPWRPAPAPHHGRAPMPPGRAVAPPARPHAPPPFPPQGRPLPPPEQCGPAIAASAIPAPRDGAAPVPHDEPVPEPASDPGPSPRPSRAAVITLSPRPRSA